MSKSRNVIILVFVIAVMVGLVAVPVVQGQSSDAPVKAPRAMEQSGNVFDTGMSWSEILSSGGWLMYVLSGMSVLTLAFVFYFMAVLRIGQIAPRPLYRELMEKIRSGLAEDAIKACEYHPCPLSSVAMTAMEHVRENPEIDPNLLKDFVESEGERQADMIQGQTQYLLDIAVIAPMIGLLGTVLGILHAFSGVALSSVGSKPVVLAGGITKALVTTAAGLLVAIPAMIAYSYFRRKAARLVSHLESASTELLAVLTNRGGK